MPRTNKANSSRNRPVCTKDHANLELTTKTFPPRLEELYWKSKKALVMRLMEILLSDDEEAILAMASEVLDPEEQAYERFILASENQENWIRAEKTKESEEATTPTDKQAAIKKK